MSKPQCTKLLREEKRREEKRREEKRREEKRREEKRREEIWRTNNGLLQPSRENVMTQFASTHTHTHTHTHILIPLPHCTHTMYRIMQHAWLCSHSCCPTAKHTHTQCARKRALNRLSDIDSLMPCHLTVFRFSSQSNTSRTHAEIWLPDSRIYRSILQKQGDRNPISMKHCDFTAPHNSIMPQAQLQSSYQSSYSIAWFVVIYFPLLSFCF